MPEGTRGRGRGSPKKRFFFFKEIGNIWQYDTSQVTLYLKRQSRAHETDTSNHQTSQTKARIKFPHKQKGMFLNFCRRGGLSRSRSTASTLNDSGVRGSISSILFHQEIRIKDPKQPKIHWSNNYNFSAAPPTPFQYRNEKCQWANKGLSWIMKYLEQQQLVGIFYLVLNRGPDGGGAVKKIPFLRWALALPPPYLPPPPPPPPPPSPPQWRRRTHREPPPLWWPRWQCTLAIFRQLRDNFDTTLGQL